MREIKFRGRGRAGSFNGKWVYGNYIYQDYNSSELSEHLIHNTLIGKILVAPESVGQFTGLKDKAGKEIYEGDICRKTYGSATPLFVVDYHEARLMFIARDGYNEPLYQINHTQIEIIGNIYENPNLTEP